VNADPELDAAIDQHARVTLDHCVLHFDGATHCVDHAAKLDEGAVAGALDDAPIVHGDRRVDEVAAQRPQSGKRAILVDAGQTAKADDVAR
jgi:hypothetical protein